MNEIFGKSNLLGQTPGQIIKAARDAKQISLNEVAQRLLLSKQIIIAIEEDNYSRIPARVYAEGYLKAYAQFLKIPADEVIARFRNLNIYDDAEKELDVQPKINKSLNLSYFFQSKSKLLLLLVGLGVLILVFLLLFIHQGAEIASSPSKFESSDVISSEEELINPQSLPVMVTTDEVNNVVESGSGKRVKDSMISTDVDKNSPDSLTADSISKPAKPKNNLRKD